MKIAIVGYGRMGHAVEDLAAASGYEICAIFDIDRPFTQSSDTKDADVCIEFSTKDTVLTSLQAAAKLNIPMVEGTTGWYENLDQIRSIANLTMIYSPNFSIGMYQFMQIIQYAAQRFSELPHYDCYVHEWHHAGKSDSPSGTAKKIAAILVKTLRQKEKPLYDSINRVISPNELHVTSTRVGTVTGTHQVGFNSEFDSILLKHEAHNRAGFAYGALCAAEWIVNQKGILTMDDFMNSLTRSNQY